MSDAAATASGGGGDGGGGAGAGGQDEAADNEPPQRALLEPGPEGSGLGEMAEEGAPPSAKRAKMGEEDREQERIEEEAVVQMCGEAPEQADPRVQEDGPSLERSSVSTMSGVKTGDGQWCVYV